MSCFMRQPQDFRAQNNIILSAAWYKREECEIISEQYYHLKSKQLQGRDRLGSGTPTFIADWCY